MTWTVYRLVKYQTQPNESGIRQRRELLGTVEAGDWGTAHAEASRRWPLDARPQIHYPKGRLILRPASTPATEDRTDATQSCKE